MLISFKQNFIFVHVYKTAGTSVRRTLCKFCYEPHRTLYNRILNKYCGVRIIPNKDLSIVNFLTNNFHARTIDVRNFLSPEVYNKFFTFAFVRNPWDWQVSLYHYMRQTSFHPQYNLGKSFNDFDEYLSWRIENEVRLQSDFLLDENNKFLVDFVGRVETIDNDFQYICNKLGIDAKLPHANKSKRGNYKDYYNDKTIDLVADSYKKDIELFGYSFDNFQKRPVIT